MIHYLKGRLVSKEPTHVVIDVNGIGYLVNISLNTFTSIKDQEQVQLETYFHVKEDSQTLYGFANSSERTVFKSLISITGVGPSTAMMVLSSMTPDELKNAILTENVVAIKGVKGIGAKTAQRIVLELKDKLIKEPLEVDSGDSVLGQHNTIKSEALSALLTLGISRQAAEKSLSTVLQKSGNNLTLEELIKRALKIA